MTDTPTSPNEDSEQSDVEPEDYFEAEEDGPREPTEREEIIAEITGLLMKLDMVLRTSYSGENHYDTTPHQLSIVMDYHTDRETVKTLGKVVTSLVKAITPETVRASVEHPYRHVEDDEGNQNMRDNKHIDKISIRWNERWATTPAAVRGPNGEAIDTSDVEKMPLEKVNELAEKLHELDLAHRENKKKQIEEKQTNVKCEEEGEETA